MAQLPKPGDLDWGGVLNEFLQQSLDSTGKLVTGATNPLTGAPNTNLASNSQAGLVQLAGDLTHTAASPKVSGLQGKPVASTQPTNGQTLVWNAKAGQWQPTTLPGADPASGGGNPGQARSMAINSVRI